MKQRATAIAIATLMVAAGLSVVPTAVAGSGDCQKDFDIATSESLASSRDLPADTTKVGHTDVLAGNDRNLTIELDTAGELDWEVFYKDDSTSCTSYDAGDCEAPNTIDQKGEQDGCVLQGPTSGTRDFYVHYTNPLTGSDDDLMFTTWASVI